MRQVQQVIFPENKRTISYSDLQQILHYLRREMDKIFWGKKKKKVKRKKGRNLRFKGGSEEQSAATDQGLSCPEELISSNLVPADFFLCWQSSSFIYIKCFQGCEAAWEVRSRLHALRSPRLHQVHCHIRSCCPLGTGHLALLPTSPRHGLEHTNQTARCPAYEAADPQRKEILRR